MKGMIAVYVSSTYDKDYKLSHITTSDLEVVTAGYAIVEEGDAGAFRPNGLQDYQLLYIKEGCGHFTIGGEEVTLTEKTAIIFHPFEPQLYRYSKIERPKTYWIHIGGPLVESLLKAFGIWEDRIFHLTDDSKLISFIQHTVSEMIEKKRGYKEMAIAYSIQAFASVARNKTVLPHNAKQNAIEQTIIKIRREYTENTSNADYAAEANMSLAHFLRLFKEKTGMTPHSFKLQLRIAAAKDMLINTTYKVNDIAQSVGFNDSLYFCKYFHKIVGDTPSNFRKKNDNR